MRRDLIRATTLTKMRARPLERDQKAEFQMAADYGSITELRERPLMQVAHWMGVVAVVLTTCLILSSCL